LQIEREEDRPQIVQLKSGDLGEKEYLELKSKEEIENAASSFGKILFKRPQKKNANPEVPPEETESKSAEESAPKKSEIDLIFNLDKDGAEKKEEEIEETSEEDKEKQATKKKFLDDEETVIKPGLQEPVAKKRFVDGPTTKVTTLHPSKVLAREAKAGNKKLLSFYDEEEEEQEEYLATVAKEREAKQQRDDESD
jgi:hypothetical protein